MWVDRVAALPVHYMGGKAKIGPKIARYLEEIRRPGQLYVEPFVGAANIVACMTGVRHVYDAHPDLIMMWRALQTGWRPPDHVTEDMHRALRKAEPSAIRAFVGFGCSFGGKFFGGFARATEGTNYARAAMRSLDRKLATLDGVIFRQAFFHELTPSDSLVYCDPPYEGTAGFSVGKFDHMLFWETMREWSKCNTVIISEKSAPRDFEVVQELSAPCGFGDRKPRREFLFKLRD